jgi:hypothetical protein
MKNAHGLLCVSVLATGAAAVALGDTTVALPMERCNTLYQDAGGTVSGGSSSYLFSGAILSGELRRGLMLFDLAGGAVPSGATVVSATLTLHVSNVPPEADPVQMTLHRVQAAWGSGASVPDGPGGFGAPAENGDATWLHRFYDASQAGGGQVRWTNPGGDFEPASLATAAVGGVGSYDWAGPALASVVQSWITDPATNFGLMLVGDEATARTARRFDSQLNPNAAVHPVLTVVYQEPVAACDADLGSQGGVHGSDGELNNNDFIAFIDLFFAHDPLADFGAQGGVPGQDGHWNNNDFIAFIDAFFSRTGCP